MNKSFFYKLFLFVIGSILTVTTSYIIFIGNYVYRSYKFPEVILSHSISEALKGQIPTLLTRLYATYMDNKIYVNNFDNYQDYRSHSLNPKKNMHSYYASSHTNGGVTDSHIDSGYGSGYGYGEGNESTYNEIMDYAENYSNYDSGPGVHEVSGYTRSDGTEVDGYLRTNPDGIEENNFSYRGY
ncbi:hypothetical protein [Acinetobacter sp. NEB 394]|jgi:hypothetical protein|uniref:hypothetical protein n=1 Tax=Acinetobacter sp. NEB 394 TaxID=2743575 RepID=UPI001596A9B3|nr:hypothetical protein [Acinetobacter sp. NEB 394]QKY91271.1 hypothetical protein HUK62_12770 [Acinetobacter sp. NEB 394]